jgi:hypothetical protein
MTINGLLISWLAAAASVATERRISDGPSAGVIFQTPFDIMLLTLIGGTPPAHWTLVQYQVEPRRRTFQAWASDSDS